MEQLSSLLFKDAYSKDWILDSNLCLRSYVFASILSGTAMKQEQVIV